MSLAWRGAARQRDVREPIDLGKQAEDGGERAGRRVKPLDPAEGAERWGRPMAGGAA